MKIYRVERTTSTNDDARSEQYVEGDVVWAEHQTAGRGQRGHKWESAEGQNVTFSVVLTPRFLPVREQFCLSQITALALTDTFAHFGIATRIKWTNDIYADDRKICGVLIEHDLQHSELARTIIGVGININQTEFDSSLPNPVSMRQIAKREFDREEVLVHFVATLLDYYEQLRRGRSEELARLYVSRMYRLGERHTFAYPDGKRFEASICGARTTGELMLRHADGEVREYAFKEVEFVFR